MKTKTYKRFATVAATSALIGSAIVPVAAAPQEVAEEFSYSDVPTSSSHYVNIMKARELGIMSGYQDGTFKPNQKLNRGNVAKALGKYVVAKSGMSLDEYVEEHNIADVENFSDVPNDWVDSELVTYSKIVKEAGIFKGSDNKLEASKLMPRDQIAEVLVRAFGFEDQEGDPGISDTEQSGYAKSIEIIYENGISNANPYRPLETTSRGQFASFLVRAYEATESDPAFSIESVEAVDATIDNDTEGQFATFTINDGQEANLDQLKEEGYTVEFLSTEGELFADTATGEIDPTALEGLESVAFQVKLTKDGEEITSNEATLTVEDFQEVISSLDSYKLTIDDREANEDTNTIVLNEESGQISNVVGTTKSGDENAIDPSELTYTSSNEQVAIVSETGEIVPVAPGDANITVTHEASGETLTVPVKVASDERKPSTATTSAESMGLAAGAERTFSFTLTDQYGMPYESYEPGEITVTNGEEETIATVNVTGGDKGEYIATVTASAVEEDAEGDIILLDDDTELLSIPLEVGADTEAASHRLELANGVADSTLDLNPLEGDQTLELIVSAYNKDGHYIGATEQDNFTVQSNNENVSAEANGDGTFTVTANSAGDSTLTLKEGTISRNSVDVTVQDTTPTISSVTYSNKEVEGFPVALTDLVTINLTSNDNIQFEVPATEENSKSKVVAYVEGTVANSDGSDETVRINLATLDTVSTNILGLKFEDAVTGEGTDEETTVQLNTTDTIQAGDSFNLRVAEEGEEGAITSSVFKVKPATAE
ncbi:S-layer homology domain-containing protein [Bhargavaea ginsengi]|uniref:S-layer homology domain-containing protein n=1 Tax=Bhargavaea ginsengi TaxID=426757 RepID=A0A1H7ACL3_9BACL|nr:S-layer homology domain-containing protein [Bhargavaea ginsengi]SEJ63138.1 S-layer homology domain-containing protein [Bhargavaea ginsengi]